MLFTHSLELYLCHLVWMISKQRHMTKRKPLHASRCKKALQISATSTETAKAGTPLQSSGGQLLLATCNMCNFLSGGIELQIFCWMMILCVTSTTDRNAQYFGILDNCTFLAMISSNICIWTIHVRFPPMQERKYRVDSPFLHCWKTFSRTPPSSPFLAVAFPVANCI